MHTLKVSPIRMFSLELVLHKHIQSHVCRRSYTHAASDIHWFEYIDALRHTHHTANSTDHNQFGTLDNTSETNTHSYQQNIAGKVVRLCTMTCVGIHIWAVGIA